MKLLRVSKKVWFFVICLTILTIGFSSWILAFKIEMNISVILEINDFGQKLIINRHQINYVADSENIVLKIKNKYIKTNIENINFNYEKDYYELDISYFGNLLANSKIEVEIIYQKIPIIFHIFNFKLIQ